MAQSPIAPTYKSEVFIPIKQDDQTFEQRQHGIWDDMHERMEKRRREWEQEVENMRQDFFKLKPNEIRRDSQQASTSSGEGSNHVDNLNATDLCFDTKSGDRKFQVSFDVSQFNAEEINVQNKDRKLVVHAKHEEKGPGKSVCREFSRSVDIPKYVDPEQLTCTLSNDGILQIEAPCPEPDVQKVTHQSSFSSMHMEPPSFDPAPSTSPTLTGPILTETDGSRKFKISVDIGGEFLPEDVVVKTIDKKLLVQARHETKTAGRTSSKEFSRQFDLPENVDPNLVTASMTDDGKLIIEAPIIGSSYTSGQYTGKPGSKKQPQVNISFNK